MTRKEAKAPRRRRIELDGTFDVPAARRLEVLLEGAPPEEVVEVDLSRIREFHDFGVAMLAQTLKQGTNARVVLKGLRQHQLRLMRYFGVDASRFAPRTPAAELG